MSFQPFVFLYLAGLLLIGLLSTRLMKLIKMPNVTGYILTGIIIFFLIGCEFFVSYKLEHNKHREEA